MRTEELPTCERSPNQLILATENTRGIELTGAWLIGNYIIKYNVKAIDLRGTLHLRQRFLRLPITLNTAVEEEEGLMLPIVQVWKLRHKEFTCFGQDHTSSVSQTQVP